MTRGRTRERAAAACAAFLSAALAVSGCGAGIARPASRTEAPPTPGRVSATPDSPPVYVAERQARDLGQVPPAKQLSVTLTLRTRDQAGLQALLDRGGRVSPSEWAASYGPDPSGVAALQEALSRGGISSRWRPGQVLLTLTASAGAIERFFDVAVHDFVLGDGTRFYAPLSQPAVPAAIAREVVAVTGMDDYPRHVTAAVESPDGVTPSQMTSFYDMMPLRDAGFDGTGITVMFPEWAVPQPAVLDAYASKFGLPPFDIGTPVTDPAWGEPVPPSNSAYAELAGEAALDLEVVHGLAPGAQEIVYGLSEPSKLPTMLEAMVTAHPHAILSSSIFIHPCEDEVGAKQDSAAEDAVFAQAAGLGTSIFFASGDRGAFACLPDGQASTRGTISVEADAASPNLTAVGGTTVFLSSNGQYFKEAAWGEPLEQWGSGGGVSTLFARPSWQTGPGVGDISGRGVPDVSANADIISGWDIFSPSQSGGTPSEGPVGGTSAATPCWAAITALVDEDLAKQGLRAVGFANPGLYLFASNPPGLPAPAFHEITEGSNLHYPATPGWNPATGLGSPDVAHLADDFEWYDRTR